MNTAQQAYTMLGNESLWNIVTRCHELLEAADIPHAIIGGVAVCLHGYQRNTVDLDLLIRASDAVRIREVLEQAGFTWSPDQAEFRSAAGVPVHFVRAGDLAGSGSEVRLADPGDERSVTRREGLPVLSLARLIESKLACGQGNLRRTHKDFADVVELIATNQLGQSFARHLHKSLRAPFRELVRRTSSPDG